MSRENVEIVESLWQAYADEGLDAMTDFWDVEINWRAIPGAPDDLGEMQGLDAVRRYLQDWLDTFENITCVPEELIEVGDDRVIAVQHVTGRARLSGIETELRLASVYWLREGKIVRVREFGDREQALHAVGVAD